MFTVQVSSDNWWSPQDGCYIYTAWPGPGGHVGDRVTGATGGDGDRCRCWANPLCIRTSHYGSNRCKINTDWAPTVSADGWSDHGNDLILCHHVTMELPPSLTWRMAKNPTKNTSWRWCLKVDKQLIKTEITNCVFFTSIYITTTVVRKLTEPQIE